MKTKYDLLIEQKEKEWQKNYEEYHKSIGLVKRSECKKCNGEGVVTGAFNFIIEPCNKCY
jgi:hypothetical protein